MPFTRTLILGTGLIGASLGSALRARRLCTDVIGWDRDAAQLETALRVGALDRVASDPVEAARASDIVVLAVPVLAILEWMERLSPALAPHQLVTDVGSTKREIADRAAVLFGRAENALFLPGHPMAGKESGGAALADPHLFEGAAWLFTPVNRTACPNLPALEASAVWRKWVTDLGCRVIDFDPVRHDVLCAWVSHLPQMVSTALASLMDDELSGFTELNSIGGRALKEMTRLGASPFSMWGDIAHTNSEPLANALLALEQRIAQLRENLRTPDLRNEFARANHFRSQLYGATAEDPSGLGDRPLRTLE